MKNSAVTSPGSHLNTPIRLGCGLPGVLHSKICDLKLIIVTLICVVCFIPVSSLALTPPPAKSVKELSKKIDIVSLLDEMVKLDKGIKRTLPCSQYDGGLWNTKLAMQRLNADTSLSDAEYNKIFSIREAELKKLQKQYKQCFSDKFRSVSTELKFTKVLELESLGYDGFEKKYDQLKSIYYDPEASINYEVELKDLIGRQNLLILTWLEENFQEVRDFRGVDDPRISRGVWEKWVKVHVNKLVEKAKTYQGIHNQIVIPGETYYDKRDGIVMGYFKDTPIVSLFAGEGKLIQLLSGDDLPTEHRHDNPYAAMTASTESPLRKMILRASPHSLLPEDVLKLSLDVSGGSYPLAVMTGHAVLKITTKKGRGVIERMFARARSGKWDKIQDLANSLKPYSDIANRLHNLRPGDDKTGDKLGPWYHGFGLLTAGALSSPEGASIGARGEHMSKGLGWFVGEGGYNAEKEYTDRVFSDATYELKKYNRDDDATMTQ